MTSLRLRPGSSGSLGDPALAGAAWAEHGYGLGLTSSAWQASLAFGWIPSPPPLETRNVCKRKLRFGRYGRRVTSGKRRRRRSRLLFLNEAAPCSLRNDHHGECSIVRMPSNRADSLGSSGTPDCGHILALLGKVSRMNVAGPAAGPHHACPHPSDDVTDRQRR